MATFTSKVRASLLSDAARAPSLRRWSIRDLLGVRAGEVEDAKSLLRSLQVRLAVQHRRLVALATAVEAHPGTTGREAARDAALGHLTRLRRLHENTYCLPHRLTCGDGQALWEHFSARPNRAHVAAVFEELQTRHVRSVEALAEAAIRARDIGAAAPRVFEDGAVEAFLHSRLLCQLLCDHYVSLHKGKQPTGAVSLGADAADVVRDAVAEATNICDANLGVAPEVHVQDGWGYDPPPLIPSLLHYAIVEVTKNAMASNLERWGRKQRSPASVPPCLYVHLARDSPDFLSIRILDQGVGLRDPEQAFGFARTSSPAKWDRLEEQQSYAAVRPPLGSLGVGLPLSRLMMRVFGGDLVVANRDRGRDVDSGCTATLRISYDDTYQAAN